MTSSPATAKWPIQNLHCVFQSNNKQISETFHARDIEYRLEFVPVSVDDPDHSQLWFISHQPNRLCCPPLFYKFWLENDAGQSVSLDSLERDVFVDNATKYHFCISIPHNSFYSQHGAFVLKDSLIICCQVGPKALEKRSVTPSDVDELLRMRQLHERMSSFYERGFAGSCVIRVGEKAFSVETTILMASSPYFENLFTSGSQEARTGIINVRDTTPEAMDTIIKYMYSCKVDNADKLTEAVYALAVNYFMLHLKNECVVHLCRTADKTNFLKRLVLAFHSNDKDFQDRILAYLTDARSEGLRNCVFLSKEWCDLMIANKPLADAITNVVYNKLGFSA